jgi:hypothetical protein
MLGFNVITKVQTKKATAAEFGRRVDADCCGSTRLSWDFAPWININIARIFHNKAVGKLSLLCALVLAGSCSSEENTKPREIHLRATVEGREGATTASWKLSLPREYYPHALSLMTGPNSPAGIDLLEISFHWPTLEPAERHKYRIALMPHPTRLGETRQAWPYVTTKREEFFFNVTILGDRADARAARRNRLNRLKSDQRCEDPHNSTEFLLVGHRCSDGFLAYIPQIESNIFEINPNGRVGPGGSLSRGTGMINGWRTQIAIPIGEIDLANTVLSRTRDFLMTRTIHQDNLEQGNDQVK